MTNENKIMLNVVLLGTTGAGKSATGNMLLGHAKFESSPNRESVTGECSVDEVNIFGTRLVVVDTPGILDTNMPEDDLKVMLKECTHLACPGVHAFLFLMKIGERDIEGKDKKTFDLITKMFGEKFLDHTIVVFTARKNLGNEALERFVSRLPCSCKTFIESCKGGYLAVENLHTDEQEQAVHCKQVVDKVKKLVQKNNGGYYKNKLFDEENEKIQKRMEHLLEQNKCIKTEIKEAERKRQSLIASFNGNSPTKAQIRRLKDIEDKISKNRNNLIDRKSARLKADNEIKYIENVKIIIGCVAGVGGAVAAAATGGAACIVVANPVFQTAVAAVGTVAGTTISSAVGLVVGCAAGGTAGTAVGTSVGVTTGLTVGRIFSTVIGKIRGIKIDW
ncbi:GTPase IMAP family member 9-like [Argopecten irradians]|uniref:GTPase IMAP family member 9-like n=1 Tax=Argopecten irradians TaxID=31199 RepID=UPI00371FC634